MGPGDKGRGGERKQEKLGELISPRHYFSSQIFLSHFSRKKGKRQEFPHFLYKLWPEKREMAPVYFTTFPEGHKEFSS